MPAALRIALRPPSQPTRYAEIAQRRFAAGAHPLFGQHDPHSPSILQLAERMGANGLMAKTPRRHTRQRQPAASISPVGPPPAMATAWPVHRHAAHFAISAGFVIGRRLSGTTPVLPQAPRCALYWNQKGNRPSLPGQKARLPALRRRVSGGADSEINKRNSRFGTAGALSGDSCGRFRLSAGR